MNLLTTGFLHPLKDLDTTHSISRVSDDFDAKMAYSDTVNELNDLHDELAVLTPAKEAIAQLQLLPNSVFRSIALEALGTDHEVRIAAVNARIEELK